MNILCNKCFLSFGSKKKNLLALDLGPLNNSCEVPRLSTGTVSVSCLAAAH